MGRCPVALAKRNGPHPPFRFRGGGAGAKSLIFRGYQPKRNETGVLGGVTGKVSRFAPQHTFAAGKEPEINGLADIGDGSNGPGADRAPGFELSPPPTAPAPRLDPGWTPEASASSTSQIGAVPPARASREHSGRDTDFAGLV